MAQSLVDMNSEISRQSKACLAKFRALDDSLQAHQVPVSLVDGIALEDNLAKFTAWGRNIAAFQDSKTHVSLGERLKVAPAIQIRVLHILIELQEYLQAVDEILEGEEPNTSWPLGVFSDSSSDSGDDHPDHNRVLDPSETETLGNDKMTSDIQELLRAISTSVSSLMRLSVVIRNSASCDDYLKAASKYRTWDANYDIGHVNERHGKAQRSENWLLERLGNAVTRRRQFLKYREEHHGKLTTGKKQKTQEGLKETIMVSNETKKFDGKSGLVEAVDSDAGDSFGSQTSYDPTVFGKDGCPINLTVPPPPISAFAGVPFRPFRYGEAFQCPYCYTEQIVKNKYSWKKHVFRDLRPYVCTFQDCELLMFQSRNAWFSHELQIHRKVWICQYCDHDPLKTAAAFSEHVKLAHEDILVLSSLEALILQSEEMVDKISSTACLLCDDWEADLRQSRLSEYTGKGYRDEVSNVYGTPEQFRKHLGNHLEQLALFALPSSQKVADVDGGSSEVHADDESMKQQEFPESGAHRSKTVEGMHYLLQNSPGRLLRSNFRLSASAEKNSEEHKATKSDESKSESDGDNESRDTKRKKTATSRMQRGKAPATSRYDLQSVEHMKAQVGNDIADLETKQGSNREETERQTKTSGVRGRLRSMIPVIDGNGGKASGSSVTRPSPLPAGDNRAPKKTSPHTLRLRIWYTWSCCACGRSAGTTEIPACSEFSCNHQRCHNCPVQKH